MICPDCGRELEEVFKITDNESDLLQYAINREDLGKTSLKPNNLKKHSFKSSTELYLYIKNSLNVLSEGDFLKKDWEQTIRKKYNYNDEFGEMIILDGKVYRHKQWVIK